MLGSIARKLRIFGFDTLYVANVEDGEILKLGIDQERTILTADKEFFKRIVKARASGVLVGGSNELEDIVHILERAGVRIVDPGEIGTRCSICNGTLELADASDISTLPERVTSGYTNFFKCISCGKLYWEGTHLKRIRVFIQRINDTLAKAQLR